MHRPTINKHLLYWVLPTCITLFCVFTYFFNLFGLSHWIAHPINREFGVAENLQLLLLIAIFVLALRGIKLNSAKQVRLGFKIIAGITVLLLMEEIDYGLHYWDYLMLENPENVAVMDIDYSKEVRNLHNNGDVTSISKMLSYVLIVTLFVIIPLASPRMLRYAPALQYLSPSRMVVATAVCLLLVNHVALYLYRNYEHSNQALNGNISEFEEIMTYYIFFLYIRELASSAKPYLLLQYYQMKKQHRTEEVVLVHQNQ